MTELNQIPACSKPLLSPVRVFNGDCLEIMKSIPDGSIDMVLCDLPYNVTGLKWDSIIPFNELWYQYERIIKPSGAIVLTAMQPFTTELIYSNKKMFKYTWVWNKVKPGNFLTAKLKPMQSHEDVLIFSKANTANGSKNNMVYYPVLEKRLKKRSYKKEKDSDIYARKNTFSIDYETDFKYPKSILEFSNANQKNKLHPTQKPIALFEYLIQTYTKEGETVLDNCAGSGTTGIACMNTNRNCILIEKEQKYFDIINERIAKHTQQRAGEFSFENEL